MKTAASLYVRMVTIPKGWWWLPISPRAYAGDGRNFALYDQLVFNEWTLASITMEAGQHYCRAWAGRGDSALGHVYLGIGLVDEMRKSAQEWLYNRLWARPGPLPFGLTVHDLGILQADDLLLT